MNCQLFLNFLLNSVAFIRKGSADLVFWYSPPLYLLNDLSPAYINAGSNKPGGQLVRSLPSAQNGNAAKGMWKGICFQELLTESALSNRDLKNKVDAAGTKLKVTDKHDVAKNKRTVQRFAEITVNQRPEFSISSWPAAAANDGLDQNPCCKFRENLIIDSVPQYVATADLLHRAPAYRPTRPRLCSLFERPLL